MNCSYLVTEMWLDIMHVAIKFELSLQQSCVCQIFMLKIEYFVKIFEELNNQTSRSYSFEVRYFQGWVNVLEIFEDFKGFKFWRF